MDEGREGREGYSISASTTPPQPITPSEASDGANSDVDWDPRDEVIENCKRELQQLRNRLASKDQELAESQEKAQRHKAAKKQSNDVTLELHKAMRMLSEEKERLQESKVQMEQYRAQAEQYKAQAEQLHRAAADASATSAAAAAELKQARAREGQLEEELRNSQATVEDLRSKLDAFQKSHELLETQLAQAQAQGAPAQAAQATQVTQAQSQSQLSPKLQASVPPANGKSPASARPAKNIHMVPKSGSIDLEREGVTRFTESPASSAGAAPAPSKLREVAEVPKGQRQKAVLFSNEDCAHQSTVGKVHLPGYGITDGASTLAKVLLSRIQYSVYAPGYRRQQQQYQQQMGMQMMAQNGMQQMQANHIVQVPVQPVGLPSGGHMPVHGMNLPTQG